MRSTGRKLQREPMTPQLPPIRFGNHLKQHVACNIALELYVNVLRFFGIVVSTDTTPNLIFVFLTLFLSLALTSSVGTLQLVQFSW